MEERITDLASLPRCDIQIHHQRYGGILKLNALIYFSIV